MGDPTRPPSIIVDDGFPPLELDMPARAAEVTPATAGPPPATPVEPPPLAPAVPPPIVAAGLPPLAPAGPPPNANAGPPPSQRGEATTVPESGDLAQTSTVRLYATAALTSASGWLQLELDRGRILQLSFRRGTPEHLSSDDPELSLLRFLQSRGLITAEQGHRASEQSSRGGQDLVSVLFQMQLIPPAEAHRILDDYSMFLLDRALATWRGKFSFEADAPAPPGAFPLGQRWTLLAEAVRRIDPALLRARLGRRLSWPVLRSGGLGIGKVEQLALNAQETRLYSSIDGTRTGEELLSQQDGPTTLRLLYLLTELGHLAFGELFEEAPSRPPEPSVPSASAAQSPGDKPRELPRIARPPPPGRAGLSQPPAMQPPTRAVQPGSDPPARALPRAEPPAALTQVAAPPAPAPKSTAPPAQKFAAPPASKSAAPPAPKSAAPPVIPRPPPVFAAGPQGEFPAAMLARLKALLARLVKVDHFEALGLDRKSVSAGEVKRNFFALAKELHPDTVTDPDQADLRTVKEHLFSRINEASQVLADDVRRAAYQKELDGLASNVDVGRIFAAEENFQRAEIMIKARKYADGLALLEEAIAINADEAEFYAWRGYARFLISKDRRAAFTEAAGDCRKAIKMIDKCLPAHLFLGHMAKAVGDMKLAEQCYHRVLQLDHRNVEAQRELRLMGKKS